MQDYILNYSVVFSKYFFNEENCVSHRSRSE